MKTRVTSIIFVLISSLYFVSCDKDVSVTPPEKPAPTGAFGITSNPPGAEIFVNNKTTGRITPDSLSWLSEGKYSIKLTLPLYRDTVFSIDVSEKQKTNISVDYMANPTMYGTIVSKSKPDHAAIFIDGKMTNYHAPDTLKNMLPGVYTLTFKSLGCRDASAKVIVKSGTETKASVVLQDTTVWLTYNKSNSGLPSNNLTSVGVDGSGTVWIGTVDRGLVSFDGLNWKTYNTSNSELPSNNITCLAIRKQNLYGTPANTIYIGTPEGLAVFTFQYPYFNRYVFNKGNSAFPDNYITSVSVDQWGYIWAGTPKGLVVIPDDWTNIKVFDLASKFGENWITGVAATSLQYNKHEAWIGLENNGIVLFDYTSAKWTLYARPSASLPTNSVRSIAAENLNDVWAGFAGSLMSAGNLGHYTGAWGTRALGSANNIVLSIFAKYGIAWACTMEGLYSISPSGGITSYNTSNSGLPSNSLTGIYIDPDENAWISTAYEGLVLFKKYNSR